MGLDMARMLEVARSRAMACNGEPKRKLKKPKAYTTQNPKTLPMDGALAQAHGCGARNG